MLPDDEDTLTFLCIAYEHAGEHEKYRQALTKLVSIIIRNRNIEAARKLLDSFTGTGDAETLALEQKVRAMLTPMMGLAALKTIHPDDDQQANARSPDSVAAVMAEVHLVGWLEENSLIKKEVADRLTERLTALGNVQGDILISALSVLENENPGLAETVASAVANDTCVPPISLELFEQYQTMAKLLPERMVKVRGAIPFGKISDEILVALANPMDSDLKTEIENVLGAKCHFFFVPPLSLGIVLGRLYPEENK